MTAQLNIDLLTNAAGTGSPAAKGLVLTNTTAAPANSIAVSALDDAVQFLTPTSDILVNLNNTHRAGRAVTIFNQSSTKVITVVAEDLTVIRTIYPKMAGTVVPLQDTPSTTAHWAGQGPVVSPWMTLDSPLSVIDHGNSSPFTNTAIENPQFKRDGDTARVRGAIVFSGAPAPTTPAGADNIFVLLMPPVFLPKTSLVLANNQRIMGSGDYKVAGVDKGPCTVVVNDVVTILGYLALRFKSTDSAGPFDISNPDSWVAGDRITFDVDFPVSTWEVDKG